jgi:Chaperone of endosialidase
MTDESPKRETEDQAAEPQPERSYEPPEAEELPEDKAAGTGTGLNGNTQPTSDRNYKRDFEPVDAEAVLAGVVELPIQTWSYREDDPRVRHVGPMAQDFAAAFAVGDDDRHIHTVDAGGVALAAIQALAARLAAAEALIEELQAERDLTAV